MGHLGSAKHIYKDLLTKVDAYPIGIIDDEKTEKLLKALYTPEEADLVSHMPLKISDAATLAQLIGREETALDQQLSGMAVKGIVFKVTRNDKNYYAPMWSVPGFVEMTMMKVRDDIPQAELAHLLSDMMKDKRFMEGIFQEDTQFGRALIDAKVAQDTADVLPYEVAADVVKEAKKLAVNLCYCRHKQEHLGHPCQFPTEVCLAMNSGAEFVIQQKFGRQISTGEALDIIEKTSEMGLMHIGDNVKNNLTFICNCCQCCCGILRGYHDHGIFPVAMASRFAMAVNNDKCVGCGKCVSKCQIAAITMEPVAGSKQRKAKIDAEVCLGCGICFRACRTGALTLRQREKKIFTPENGMEKLLTMAIERGKLQNLIFDDVHSPLHQLLRALAGRLFKNRGIKRYLLQDRVRNRLLNVVRRSIKNSEQAFLLDM